MKKIMFISFLFMGLISFAQKGKISGTVYNFINKETIPLATIQVVESNQFVTASIDGEYAFTGLEPGLYTVKAFFTGFKTKTIYEIKVTNAQPAFVDIYLEEDVQQLEGVEIKTTKYSKAKESPVSLRSIGVAEIERNPGGNRDISGVIRNLPGVGATAAFRNDIIIRGGAPNENRFYLDGVEVPNINHFATQGSSGGPVGLINVNFIKEVDYYAGAFPANRSNALSSVFNFKQKDGRTDKIGTRLTVGASDFGVTLEGPIDSNSTFILSARRSYLQFLFRALQLPFLPTYNDAQFRVKYDLNEKNSLTLIGLGAIDDFVLNEQVNDNVTDQEQLARNNYILGNLPINTQWNYTVGMVYKNYREKGFNTVVFSRNHLQNNAIKYPDNDEKLTPILDYSSNEIENKFRFENTTNQKGYKINSGVNIETATYTNRTLNQITTPVGQTTVDFNSDFTILKYGVFGQISKGLLDESLQLSFGLRTDGNTYSSDMANPISQLSPRFSASYRFAENWSLNGNIGRFNQLPAYTVMGYKDNEEFVNKDNLKYIQANHFVGGIEHNTKFNTKITVEGFYKIYENYPFLTRDSITLANLGSDFGVIGNEPAVSQSQGRSYGLEVFAQQKMTKGFFGIFAYTFVRSEFQDKNNNYLPSAWDSRHIINLTLGKKFKRNWQLGLRGRFSGGAPYTPFDMNQSALVSNWEIRNQGILDYNSLNTLRLDPFHGLDMRLDKEYFFDKWSLNIYLDIQNVYNFQAQQSPYVDLEYDANGNAIVENPNDPAEEQRYKLKTIQDASGTVLPTIGIILDF